MNTADAAPEEDAHSKYLRALAELENLRKRTQKEVAQARDQGEAYVAQAILPIIDDFQRALEAITTVKGRNAKEQIREGMVLVFSKLTATLRQLEVEGFASKGQAFTYELMEAVAQVPTRELAPGTVVAELEQGFTRKGKLLRPAKVSVAIAPKDDDAT